MPIFSSHIEAKVAEALNVLIVAHGGGEAPISESQLRDIRASITGLVDCLFPLNGDCADFSGSDSLDGIDYVHPTRVASLAAIIGRMMGLARSQLISLAMAAALMNVGYLALRRSLLDEPRRLLDGEWEEHVHTHPGRAVALLAHSGLPDDCLEAIAKHHERWDGSGYPDRIHGDGVSLCARILAVADSYISLRSVRPYRPAVDAAAARSEIARERGRLFDPDVVDTFEDVLARFNGTVRSKPTTDGRKTMPRTPADDQMVASRHNDAGAEGGAAPIAANLPPDVAEIEGIHAPRPPTRGQSTLGAVREPRVPRHPLAPPPRIESTPPVGPLSAPLKAERRRSSRTAPLRHRHPRPLFATTLYLHAAISGRWRLTIELR